MAEYAELTILNYRTCVFCKQFFFFLVFFLYRLEADTEKASGTIEFRNLYGNRHTTDYDTQFDLFLNNNHGVYQSVMNNVEIHSGTDLRKHRHFGFLLLWLNVKKISVESQS